VTWLEGQTASGTTVHIDKDPYIDKSAVLKIDGIPRVIRSIQRFRDGGTTQIFTLSHSIRRPSPLMGGRSTIDGEPLYERVEDRQDLTLPNGKPLHVWLRQSHPEAVDRLTLWICSAYDHGPLCRRCEPVAELEADGQTVGR
jgi:hypothetical protein